MMQTLDGRELNDDISDTLGWETSAAGELILIGGRGSDILIGDVDAIRQLLREAPAANPESDTERSALLKRAQDAEKSLDKISKLVISARIRIRSAQAIEYLAQYAPGALSNNVEPRIYSELQDAIADLEKAEVAAGDYIPF